ncbi:MAG: hypothetical protein U0074_10795 [Kouleothrix sp.]
MSADDTGTKQAAGKLMIQNVAAARQVEVGVICEIYWQYWSVVAV